MNVVHHTGRRLAGKGAHNKTKEERTKDGKKKCAGRGLNLRPLFSSTLLPYPVLSISSQLLSVGVRSLQIEESSKCIL